MESTNSISKNIKITSIEQIIKQLPNVKSLWELMYNISPTFKNITWDFILDDLIPLFRKDSFFDIVGKEAYYPQETPNCRYYIKPNDGSSGKGILIVNSKPINLIENHTICPEIITSLMDMNGKMCKYDYRVWVGITSNLEYFICPTFILRVSNKEFDLHEIHGSLTNLCLQSEQFNYQNHQMYLEIDRIVKDILHKLIPKTLPSSLPSTDSNTHLMLTGWDFIVNESGELFVLEVNCSPGINLLYEEIMTEYFNWMIHMDN